jgi:uncharacterized Tic20 family protein
MSTENNTAKGTSIETNENAAASAGSTATTTDAITGDKTMAMLCHLLSFCVFVLPSLGNIIGPLILWLVKKDQDPLVDATGKAVLNFQISVTIYGIICSLLIFIGIGLVLLPILAILTIIYTIIGALKANEGQVYKYPFTIQFLK